MAIDPPGEGISADDRWDQLYGVLSSQVRRMLLYSLMDVPEERRLSLPEAAMAPESSLNEDQTIVQLYHRHLPALADAGYVRWEREPFCVQRGPHYEEVETVLASVHDSIDQLPRSLIEGCEIYEEMYDQTPQ